MKSSIACASLLILLAASCSEWDKYWEDDLAGPDLTDTSPPEVTVVHPASPDSLLPTPIGGTAYSVTVVAHDDVAVRQIELIIDGESAALMTREPYLYTWNTVPLAEGSSHAVWAKARDASDNESVSGVCYAVVFNAEPGVELSAPLEGALVSGEVELVAEPDDARRPLQRIDFLVDGRVVGSASQPPYRYDWDSRGSTAGDHMLGAKAVGTNGVSGVSPFVLVSVNNEPPTVIIDFPDNGREVAVRGTVPFHATAHDLLHGEISGQIIWSSDRAGEIGRGAAVECRDLAPGVHIITASATNAWGTTGEAQVELVVGEPTYSYCFDVYFNLLLPICRGCHNPIDFPEYWVQNEFDMTSWSTLMEGGRSQRDLGLRAIDPCHPEESLLWDKVTAWSRGVNPRVGNPMPPPGSLSPLTSEQLEILRIWIEEGAPPDAGYESECP